MRATTYRLAAFNNDTKFSWDAIMARDYLHPSDFGHKIMADLAVWLIQQTVLDLLIRPLDGDDRALIEEGLPDPMYSGVSAITGGELMYPRGVGGNTPIVGMDEHTLSKHDTCVSLLHTCCHACRPGTLVSHCCTCCHACRPPGNLVPSAPMCLIAAPAAMPAHQGIRSRPLRCVSNTTLSRLCYARPRVLISSKMAPKRRRGLSAYIRVRRRTGGWKAAGGCKAGKRGGPTSKMHGSCCFLTRCGVGNSGS